MKFRLSALALLLASPAFAEGELKVYHWFEYIPQELVDKFTAETGVAVTIDTYDSNEAMLASLKAGKMGQYDVARPFYDQAIGRANLHASDLRFMALKIQVLADYDLYEWHLLQFLSTFLIWFSKLLLEQQNPKLQHRDAARQRVL